MRPQPAGSRGGLEIWKLVVNVLNKQFRIVDREWSSSLEDLGRGLTSPHCIKLACVIQGLVLAWKKHLNAFNYSTDFSVHEIYAAGVYIESSLYL